MAPILINRDTFESSCNVLKTMVLICNFFCTNQVGGGLHSQATQG